MSSSIAEFHPAFQWAVNQTLAECGKASVGSGYRTIDEQRALLYKRAQGILVADPGTSRHEGNHYGAVDMEGDLECFAAVGAKYGLTNQDVPGEPWHFQFAEEAEQAVTDGTYGDMFGMDDFAQEEKEPESDLASLRDIIFGDGKPKEAQDIPERVADAYKPKAEGGGGIKVKDPEGFAPEASAGYTGSGGSMSAVDVARVYAQAGFTGEALVNMVAISRGESGWDAGAQGDTSITDGTWGPSIGLSQIRSLNDQSGTGGWRDATRLSDPLFNARAAYAISNGGTNFGPWTVWNEGIYKKYLGEAQAAVAALGSGAVGGTGPPAASVTPPDDMGIADDIGILDTPGLARSIADDLLAATGGTDVLAKAGLKKKPDEEVPVG